MSQQKMKTQTHTKKQRKKNKTKKETDKKVITEKNRFFSTKMFHPPPPLPLLGQINENDLFRLTCLQFFSTFCYTA